MSGDVRNRKRLVAITAGNLRNSHIYIRDHFDFFPDDCVGESSRKKGRHKLLTLLVAGLQDPVRTDIPKDVTTGKRKHIFRDQKWVRKFFQKHSIREGDVIAIERIDPYTYKIYPFERTNGGAYTHVRVTKVGRKIRLEPRESLTFIDLFAGIGGIRRAFEHAGGRCVFSSEWDTQAQKTYAANFGETPKGDITKIDAGDIPDHDILTAGFPCQPFSIAGVSKKNALGMKHGFADETQGTLFFDILRILKAKQPRAFLLENVRNLKSHDKGRTFHVIRSSLEELGYDVHERVIDGQLVVPQHRERIYIVGFKPPVKFDWPSSRDISQYRIASRLGEMLDKDVPAKYTLTDHLWEYLQNYKEKHRLAGNGFGFGLVGPNDITRTLSARYYKDGSEILIRQRGKNPRRLTPRECARLMGFDRPREKDFKIPVSDTQAYKQFGNSVVVPVVQAIAARIVLALDENQLDARRYSLCL